MKKNAKDNIPKKIYIVMAHRWGDKGSHSYFLGWETNLKRAEKIADDEYEYRGRMKYSGVVYETEKGKGKAKLKEIYRKGM